MKLGKGHPEGGVYPIGESQREAPIESDTPGASQRGKTESRRSFPEGRPAPTVRASRRPWKGATVFGYCHKGHLAEDGKVTDCYLLAELTRGGYPTRTERNVVESEGPQHRGGSGGTRVTVECVRRHCRSTATEPLPAAYAVVKCPLIRTAYLPVDT
jgi:hypothetical protein